MVTISAYGPTRVDTQYNRYGTGTLERARCGQNSDRRRRGASPPDGRERCVGMGQVYGKPGSRAAPLAQDVPHSALTGSAPRTSTRSVSCLRRWPGRWVRRASLPVRPHSLFLLPCRSMYGLVSVALAYVMQKTPYVFPIVGGRKVEHLMDNIAALEITLSEEQVKYLEDVLPFVRGFPHDMIVSIVLWVS